MSSSKSVGGAPATNQDNQSGIAPSNTIQNVNQIHHPSTVPPDVLCQVTNKTQNQVLAVGATEVTDQKPVMSSTENKQDIKETADVSPKPVTNEVTTVNPTAIVTETKENPEVCSKPTSSDIPINPTVAVNESKEQPEVCSKPASNVVTLVNPPALVNETKENIPVCSTLVEVIPVNILTDEINHTTENAPKESIEISPKSDLTSSEVIPAPELQTVAEEESKPKSPENEMKETKGNEQDQNETKENSNNTAEEPETLSVQELTEQIMNILNDGKTDTVLTSHELLKKTVELQEFILKLIQVLKEKTNLCSNLEKQNTALIAQAQSLKDVISITKDLLGIRNMEVEHLHEDMTSMENRIKEERIRHNVAVARLNEAMSLNDKLKKEYLIQMDLFQKLRDKYNEKVVYLTKENQRLNEIVKNNGLENVAIPEGDAIGINTKAENGVNNEEIIEESVDK